MAEVMIEMKEEIERALFTKKMKILLFLADGPLRFTDLKNKTKFYADTLSSCLREMRKLGIIRLNFDETKSYDERMAYSLTDMGQKLAELGKKFAEGIQNLHTLSKGVSEN
jgi:DNA-binding HxlR family transcriptional regulator